MRIRKILLSVVVTAISTIVYAQEQFVAYGTIKDMGNSNGNLAVYNEDGARRFEKIQFTDGAFKYTGSVDDPTVFRLWIEDKRVVKRTNTGGTLPVICGSIWFVAIPGKEIKIEGSITDYMAAYPVDEPENKILAELLRKIFPLINEAGNKSLEFRNNKNLNDDEKRELKQSMVVLNEEVLAFKYAFLKKHVSSVAGLWLIEDMMIRRQIDMEKAESLLKNVDSNYHSVSYYNNVKARLQGYEATQIGKITPDIITTNTPDGSEFKLSALKGKYLLLDFWGTWCMPCVKGTPAMKAFRDKHADQLQIVGIAKDNKVELWKAFIEKYEMNWPHVLVGLGEENYVEKFSVNGFPTKILLDPEGKILLRSVGEKEDFYEEVEKLML